MMKHAGPARSRALIVLAALALGASALEVGAAPAPPLPPGAADSALALFEHGAVFPNEYAIAWGLQAPTTRPKGTKDESRRAFLESVVDRKLLVQAVGNHPFTPTAAQQAKLDKTRNSMMQNQLFQKVVAGIPEPTAAELEAFSRQRRMFAEARFIAFGDVDKARLWRQRLLTGTSMTSFEKAVERDGAALATIEPFRIFAAEQIPDTIATVLWSLRPGQLSEIHFFGGHPTVLHLRDFEPRPDRMGDSQQLTLKVDYQRRQFDRVRERFRQSLAKEVDRTFDEETMNFVLAAHLKLPPRSDVDSVSGLPTMRPNLPLPVFTAADTGKTIARTKDRRVTLLDYVRYWTAVTPFARPEIRERAMLEAAVDRVVLDPEILKVAFREGLDRDPLVLAEVASDREGMALDAYFAEEIEAKVKMDEKAIHALWAKDPVHYHDRAFIESRIISVERRSQADSLLARLKGGASFDQLARDYSLDTQSGSEGGKTGVQYRGSQRNVGLEDAMFNTPAGQLGGPEFTPEGWVLWKIEVNEPEVKRTFEEARTMVERDYRTMEGERLLKEKLAELHSRAKVKLFPERIDAALLAAPEGNWPD